MNNDFFTIFIFPFKYERRDGASLKPDVAAESLHGGNKNTGLGWAVKKYQLDSIDNYNEYFYFHPFVQKAIFNKKGNSGMEFLKREDFIRLEVEYYDDKEKKTKTMATKVQEINAHLFDNQIGLLTITTEKCSEADFSDILQYNDKTRRVYPPFLVDSDGKKACPLLPANISLMRKNGGQPIKEDFSRVDIGKKNEEGKDMLFMSNIIKGLLAPFELKEQQDKKKDKGMIYYTPYIDDRMFVVSYYAEKGLAEKLQKRCCDGYVYETSNDWYRFIFVDGNCANIDNENIKKELINKHTYARWAGSGNFFGMSRYSFVLLCSTEAPSYLKQHMKSMYYQIALMVLFQRAMLLKFAEDVDEITKKLDENKLEVLQEHTDKLHGEFIKFINKYWFIEVTPQEQGIEMYNQWMKLLNLKELYDEVHREISELAEYVENKIENKTNESVNIITHIGFPLGIIGIIFSFWAIDVDVIKKATFFSEIWGYLTRKITILQGNLFNVLSFFIAGLLSYILYHCVKLIIKYCKSWKF